MQQSTVRLAFNLKSLVNQLRHSFTDKTTVLSELAQNARRAGASYVAFEFNELKDRILVADNGCGITDFQTLFSKTESGWDDEVMEMDQPYGLGFLACLYSAKIITIESGEQCMTFNTDTALSFEDMTVIPGNRRQGTLISLEGTNLELREIKQKLERIAIGFPIEIKFQGESLPRPNAIDSGMDFMDCPIGSIHLYQFDDLDEPTQSFQYGTRNFIAYLQGVQVYSSRNNLSSGCNIIHLDTKQFRGRAPDRNSLVDEKDRIELVNSTIKSLWQHRLAQMVKIMTPTTVAQRLYQALSYWGRLEVLNDNPFIPTQVLKRLTEYPIHFYDWEDRYSHIDINQSIHRNDIESGHITVLQDMGHPSMDEPYQHHMYAYTLEALFLNGKLDNGHWLHQHLVVIEPDDITVHLMGPVTEAHFDSVCAAGNTLLCEAVELEGPLGRIRITEDAFVIDGCWLSSPGYPSLIEARSIGWKWYDKTIVVPRGVTHGDVVRQCDQYHDDNGADADNDNESFCHFLLSQRMGSEVSLLRDLLENVGFVKFDCFQDKTFTISITKSESERPQIQVVMN